MNRQSLIFSFRPLTVLKVENRCIVAWLWCVFWCAPLCLANTHTNKSYESCPSYMPYVRISFLQLLIFCLIHIDWFHCSQTLQWKFVMAYFFFITTVHTLAYQHVCVHKTCVSASCWFSPQIEYLTPSSTFLFYFQLIPFMLVKLEFTIFPFKDSGVPRTHYTYCLLTCHMFFLLEQSLLGEDNSVPECLLTQINDVTVFRYTLEGNVIFLTSLGG